MRLLVTTQKLDLDDPILGFFHRWVEEFARVCESVIVICLEKGRYELPANVKVLALGKEGPHAFESVSGRFRITNRVLYLWRLYGYIFKERHNYGAVFAHMNPEYVAAAGLIWRLLGKKITLWYVHRNVNFLLRIAEKLTHAIFSASAESFRLPSAKLRIVGHAIDTDHFCPAAKGARNNKFLIISVGRISPVKHFEEIIEAVALLREKNFDAELQIIGEPIFENDKKYKQRLESLIAKRNLVEAVRFLGAVPHRDIAGFVRKADVFVSATPAGSFDKAILEAMSCGIVVLTPNQAFVELLPKELIFAPGSSSSLAERLEWIIEHPIERRVEIGAKLREAVVKRYSLPKVINEISAIMEKLIK